MYYNHKTTEAAKKLIDTLPKNNEDWVVHFVNSGSEAVDLAILMARSYTQSNDILSLRNSYHGLHGPAMGATGLHVCKHTPQLDGNIKHVMNPDMYRGPLAQKKISKNDQIQIYADDVKNTITYETPGSIAGFIFEQVQGYGGIHMLPEGYMPKAAKYVKDAGGLLIADEVQSGYGRMGDDTFWSFELYGQEKHFIPDMIVTAKGLGNGLPIAAVICKRSIAESIAKKQFFNTYGGNPTVCSAASAVLDIVSTPKHRKTVANLGKKVTKMLKGWKRKYEFIGDIRGQGLMYGIEIVKDKKTREPDSIVAGKIFEDLRNNGIIMGLGGLHKNVLRVMPPMCINRDDIRFIDCVATDIFDKQLDCKDRD